MPTVCKWVCLLIMLLPGLLAGAQNGPLSEPISIEVQNKPLQQVLNLVAKEAGFSFAYNSDLIPADSLISFQANNKSVDQVLNELIGRYAQYKVVGTHVVLSPKAPPLKKPKTSFAVSGQVVNAETGELLSDVSIYSNVKLKSDITDESGSYNLNLVHREPQQTLHISKVGYQDTTVTVSLSEIYNLTVQLQPLETPLDTGKNVNKLRFVQFFTNPRQRINAINIKDPLKRVAQFSFAPILGTNWRMSGTITNIFSLNLVGGYNGGVCGIEIGGAFNIVSKKVQGIQIAGLGNTAGGQVNGVQLGGGYNLNLASMKGFQAAGGVNFQRYTFTGFQVSGGVNYADTLKGLQMTGGINIVRGLTKGVQIAPANYTKHLKGVQIGVINIADSATGTPIGLLSIVRKGYLHVDVYGDELTHTNVALRTGVRYFHNIVSIGVSYTGAGTEPLWRIGYGIGTEFRFGKKKKGFSNIDITASYINRGANFIADLNMVSTLNWDFGVRFKKHLALFAGPSVKVYTSQYRNTETGELGLSNIAWHSQYRHTNATTVNDIWVGIRGGFRF